MTDLLLIIDSIIEGNRMNLPEHVKNKIQDLKQVLDEDMVDIRRLRRLVNKGIPDEAPELREVSWKLLLKYLPS